MTKPMYCVTIDQIEEWWTSFREERCPEDLDIVKNPRFFLSCKVENANGEAHVCYGDVDAVAADSINDVYDIVELNCSSPI
jgi:hypothetical protein